MNHYDLVIIGGGINGAAIARDAAGRGLTVLLAEAGDLASQTSSASTKLVHGGLRYLEHYEFRLVRESLLEREVLLRAAPHIIWPLRIVLPHHNGLRPKWMLRLGLFLYDHLGARKLLPGTTSARLTQPPHAGVLKPQFTQGFEFSDCWVDDARLVVLCARDAADRGADVRTRTACTGLARSGDHWDVALNRDGAPPETVQARAVVNAAGRGVDAVLGLAFPDRAANNLRLVKGSHIIVPRIYPGEHLYMFQNSDDRIVFAIPYERDFTLIGTTDTPYDPGEGPPAITDAEVDYLLDLANGYLARPLTRDDIVWSYAGVRPLYDDKSDNASTVTRDYVFDLDRGSGGEPALLSIFGGKITTCRRLAEHAMERLCAPLGLSDERWTAAASLPGGDIPDADFAGFLAESQTRFAWMPPEQLEPMARRHGTRIERILGNLTRLDQLGRYFGGGLYEAEARYLIAEEWAVSADDILWRRTKCGLHMNADEIAAVTDWVS